MSNITTLNRRILLVDDNPAIHDDFRKILITDDAAGTMIDAEAVSLFGKHQPANSGVTFDLEFAFQGEEALAKVQQSLSSDRPYAAAFVDMRMPPGWDGLETIRRIWQIDPNLEVIICTAYSDYSWQDIQQTLGTSDRLLILKKPFDKVEVQQLALALTEKWNLRRLASFHIEGMEELASSRDREMVRVNQARSEFLASVSHELLTPMKAILGIAELLKETTLTPEQHTLLGDLCQSGERLSELIHKVVSFNAVESGKVNLRSIVFDARTLCEEVMGIHAAKAHAKRLELSVAVSEDVPRGLRGDPEQIKHILSALLDNAIKFTEQGRIGVQVQVVGSAPPAISFTVTDSGPGMAPAVIDSLTKPFPRMGDVTDKTNGLGVGLPLVRQLLNLMRGRLEIASTPGQGTKFSFILPYALSAETNRYGKTSGAEFAFDTPAVRKAA
jgi:signal transduction histidine kinase